MKNRINIIIAACFGILCGCTTYTADVHESGQFHYFVNEKQTEAFISDYIWNGNLNDLDIYIPDEIEGIPVKKVGGFTGTGYPEAFSVLSENDVPSDGKYDREDDLLFTIHLGEKIRNVTVFTTQAVFLKEEETVTKYNVYFAFECDENNQTYYAKDGRLYRKKDDRLEELNYMKEKIDFEIFTHSLNDSSAETQEIEAVKTEYGVDLSLYIGNWIYQAEDEEEAQKLRANYLVRRIHGDRSLYDEVAGKLSEADVISWDGYYKTAADVLDGDSFGFQARMTDGREIRAHGTNSWPHGYNVLIPYLDEMLRYQNLYHTHFYYNDLFEMDLPESWMGNVTAMYFDANAVHFALINGSEKIRILTLIFSDNAYKGEYAGMLKNGAAETPVYYVRHKVSRKFDDEELQGIADHLDEDTEAILHSIRWQGSALEKE